MVCIVLYCSVYCIVRDHATAAGNLDVRQFLPLRLRNVLQVEHARELEAVLRHVNVLRRCAQDVHLGVVSHGGGSCSDESCSSESWWCHGEMKWWHRGETPW